jgi:uncharacterized tellurite resistance protein B-like protein
MALRLSPKPGRDAHVKARLQNIRQLLRELHGSIVATEEGRQQRPKLAAAERAIVEAIELAEYARPDRGEIGTLVRVALKALADIVLATGTRADDEHRFAIRVCEKILVELLRPAG